MQGVVEESSKVKATLFAPEVSQSITPMGLILPAEPQEQEALHGVESTGTTATKTRKLPPGTDPPEMKQLSKSFEILSNSALQNPELVNILNLTCKHDLYGLLAALLSCVKASNNLLKTKMAQ